MEQTAKINNDIYNTLGKRWHTAQDDPVALLRAQSKTILPWVLNQMETHFEGRKCKVLDVACGAGFLSNPLAENGHMVTGIDLSEESLEVARYFDKTRSVDYRVANAISLPFDNETFDVVCMMDFLEHVPDTDSVIHEASRVLKPHGLFLFHTFNKNFLSWLMVIKGVEWFVKNTPEHLHVYSLFIKPKKLEGIMKKNGLAPLKLLGTKPVLFSSAFLKLLFTRTVSPDFRFELTRSTQVAYLGSALKHPL